MFIELSQRQWIDRYRYTALQISSYSSALAVSAATPVAAFPIALRFGAQTVESSMSPFPDLVVKALDEADYAITLASLASSIGSSDNSLNRGRIRWNRPNGYAGVARCSPPLGTG